METLYEYAWVSWWINLFSVAIKLICKYDIFVYLIVGNHCLVTYVRIFSDSMYHAVAWAIFLIPFNCHYWLYLFKLRFTCFATCWHLHEYLLISKNHFCNTRMLWLDDWVNNRGITWANTRPWEYNGSCKVITNKNKVTLLCIIIFLAPSPEI